MTHHEVGAAVYDRLSRNGVRFFDMVNPMVKNFVANDLNSLIFNDIVRTVHQLGQPLLGVSTTPFRIESPNAPRRMLISQLIAELEKESGQGIRHESA